MARRLGYRFVDTGMMYRALTWLALDRGYDLHDEPALAQLAEEVSIDLEAAPPDSAKPGLIRIAGRIRIDGTDVTDRLRLTEVGEAVSLVSRVPAVRKVMVARQRELAREGRVVMAGRDIGTVVIPHAPLKVYLDASPEKRARRRHNELLAMRRDETLQQVRDELALRDAIDSERTASPLRPADDAVIVDTDSLSLEQVVERILELTSCRS